MTHSRGSAWPLSAKVFLGGGVVAVTFATGFVLGRLPTVSASTLGATENARVSARDMQKFWSVWDLVSGTYVDQPVDVQKMLDGAMEGLVSGLGDPYSTYFTEKAAEEFNSELSGKFFGIGAELGLTEDGVITVIAPMKDTPADKAGLLPGDLIVKIDGEDTYGLSVSDAVTRIRGEKGKSVALTLLREGKKDPFELTIVRDEITVKSAEVTFEGDLAIVTISVFNEDTAAQFSGIAEEILTHGAKGIVLDLRNNPGGLLDAAVDIAGHFFGRDVVLIEQQQEEKHSIFANGRAELRDIPLVVLMNKGSASASEILAGALQDHGLAHVIGTTSFGKGTVQDYRSLPDGSAVKITIARWLTPKERGIDKAGIVPDQEVTLTPSSDANIDTQLQAARDFLAQTRRP